MRGTPPRSSKHRTQLQHVTTRYTLVDCLNWLLLLWLPDLDPEPCLEPDPGRDPVLPLLLWSHSSWKQQTGCFSQGQLRPTHSKTTDSVEQESSRPLVPAPTKPCPPSWLWGFLWVHVLFTDCKGMILWEALMKRRFGPRSLVYAWWKKTYLLYLHED